MATLDYNFGVLLGYQDSNLGWRHQKPLPYRLAIPHHSVILTLTLDFYKTYFMMRLFRLSKRFLPNTLFWRSVFIIVTPVVLIHLISGYVFFHRHWSYITRLLARNLSSEIGLVSQLFSESRLPFKEIKNISEVNFDIKCARVTNFPYLENQHVGYGLSLFLDALEENLKLSYKVALSTQWLTIWAETSDHSILRFQVPTKRLLSRTTLLFFIWSIGSSILLLFVALIFMRNQIKPLYHLSRWADKVGNDIPKTFSKIGGQQK